MRTKNYIKIFTRLWGNGMKKNRFIQCGKKLWTTTSLPWRLLFLKGIK